MQHIQYIGNILNIAAGGVTGRGIANYQSIAARTELINRITNSQVVGIVKALVIIKRTVQTVIGIRTSVADVAGTDATIIIDSIVGSRAGVGDA